MSEGLVDDFHNALTDLGWTKGELCKRLGLSKDAPRRWIKGPPRYVTAYLEQEQEIRRLQILLERLIDRGV